MPVEKRSAWAWLSGFSDCRRSFGPRLVLASVRPRDALRRHDPIWTRCTRSGYPGSVAEHDGAMHRIDVIEGTLAEAFGVMGGYITASRAIADGVRSFAPASSSRQRCRRRSRPRRPPRCAT